MKLSDYVASFVAKLGVKHVFALAGGGSMHLNDSFGNHPGISYISTLHEQAAAVASEAYSRVSNHIGVTLVTTGPGGTNTVTGVAAAWLDSTACLFISGQVKRDDLRKNNLLRQLGVQEIDIVSIVKSITKYAVTVLDPHSIKMHLEKAIYLSRFDGRPGPVWIDIPLDIQAAEIDATNLIGFDGHAVEKTDITSEVQLVVDKLANAKRPILLLGNGIRLAGAVDAITQLIDSLGVPVLTTRLGVDLIAFDHELHVGMPGTLASRAANFALQNSDFLLCLGARMDMALMAYAPEKLAPLAFKAMINIDKSETEKLGDFVDLAIVSDAGFFVKIFSDLTQRTQTEQLWPSWKLRCMNWKIRYPFVLSEYGSQESISTYYFAKTISRLLNNTDVILPGSSGLACEIFLTAFQVIKGQRVFHNKGTGAMGLSQPAALGACLANNRGRTICIDGDGGFHMNIQELQTIKSLNLPIKFFVLDNAGYASIRTSQTNYFKRCSGADADSGLILPNLIKVSQAYGISTLTIQATSDLEEGVLAALSMEGPVVVRVVIVKDEQRVPRVLSIKRPDGQMTSMPLESMYPYLSDEEFSLNMQN